jgi:hypothetical protein
MGDVFTLLLLLLLLLLVVVDAAAAEDLLCGGMGEGDGESLEEDEPLRRNI